MTPKEPKETKDAKDTEGGAEPSPIFAGLTVKAPTKAPPSKSGKAPAARANAKASTGVRRLRRALRRG